ncbi:MAG TPA: hypothetical protein VGS22_22540 [Thermoanaerobaculia bacterium]|nr:hypothetical protein [Thermoanaerobaculia bacterium]
MSDPRGATWPPEDLRKERKGHVEAWAPVLICNCLEISDLSSRHHDLLQGWLKDTPVNLTGLAEGRGSWNWGWMIGAARGLCLADWKDFGTLLECQANGSDKKFLGLFFGTEPLSSDYDSMRLASTLVALARGPEAIRPLAKKVLGRWAGLAALGAVPWTDRVEYRANNGQMWYQGPSLSPVGERSPKTSEPSRNELFCRLLGHGKGKVRLARQAWACAVADALFKPKDFPTFPFNGNDVPGSALPLIGNARVWGSFRFVRYPEGLLVQRPKRFNSLTPSALWSYAFDAKTEVQRGFPWDPNRANRGPGAPSGGECRIENGEIISSSSDPHFTQRFRLPSSKPLWEVIADEQGVRRAGQAPSPSPFSPLASPVFDPELDPGPDPDILIADVKALGGQGNETLAICNAISSKKWGAVAAKLDDLDVPKPNRDLHRSLVDSLLALAQDQP